MSTDDPPEGDESESTPTRDVRKRIEQEADRAREGFDESIVNLMSWVLDTETRARIYLQVRKHPHSTSEEIAKGTGLYPSTVREALSELHEEERVTRRKRESDGAGNNPYEYAALAPSELVADIVDNVQSELNTVFNLDQYLDRGASSDEEDDEETAAVTINVEEEEPTDAGANGEPEDESGVEGESLADDDSDDDSEAETEAAEDS